MRSIVGFLACTLSAVLNLALILLIGLEYWDATGLVLDQIIVVVGPTAKTLSIPTAAELHFLDPAAVLLAAWANSKARTVGLTGWFWRWGVDFAPSLGVLIVSFVTAAVMVIALMRGFDWHRLLAAVPILTIFVEAFWDVFFNHRRNLKRIVNGSDDEPVAREEPAASASSVQPRRAVEVVLADASVKAIGAEVSRHLSS